MELSRLLASEKGIDPWLGEEKLLPGQEWEFERKEAVKASQIVIILLSKRSIQQEGYLHKEIRLAADVAKEKPEGTIFVIPLRLDNCIVPNMLQRWQWLDYYEEGAYDALLRAVKERAKKFKIRIGYDSEGLSENNTAVEKKAPIPATAICLSKKSYSNKSELEALLQKINIQAAFFLAQDIPNIGVAAKESKFVLWLLDKEQGYIKWKHKERVGLLQQRRKHFVLLQEECEIPEQLSIFYSVDVSKPTETQQKLKELYRRMRTRLPNVQNNDLFIQTILEELTMGKTAYVRDLPRISRKTSIFAAMYFSGQIQEYEQLLSRLNQLHRQLPRTDFQDREFVRDLRRTVSQTSRHSQQIQEMVDLGLKVDPDHSLGIEIQLRFTEIRRMIQDEIAPSIEYHMGKHGVPPHLELRLQDLSQLMKELIGRLYAIAEALHTMLTPS